MFLLYTMVLKIKMSEMLTIFSVSNMPKILVQSDSLVSNLLIYCYLILSGSDNIGLFFRGYTLDLLPITFS